MCGIIYAKNLADNHPVNSLIKILYENQKDRGKQGFGFVGLNAERIGTYRSTAEKGIMKYLNQYQYDEIIFHHRLPTSTENTLKSTHPSVIDMDSKRYYFVHNGIIQNADELKRKHSKKGIMYSSEEGTNFNDSEALAWDFCLWLNVQQKKMEAIGSVAFVCLETDKRTKRAIRLYFYRNGEATLKIYKDKTLFILASEGNYALVKKNRLYFWEYQVRQLKRYKQLDIQSTRYFSFNEYDHYGYFADEAYGSHNELDPVEAIKADIAALEQERDYLLGIGKCIEAETIDDEIEDLKDQLKEAKRMVLP